MLVTLVVHCFYNPQKYTQTNESVWTVTVSIMWPTHPKAVLNFQKVWVLADSSTESVATLGGTYTHHDNSTTSTTSFTRLGLNLSVFKAMEHLMSFKDPWKSHSVIKTLSMPATTQRGAGAVLKQLFYEFMVTREFRLQCARRSSPLISTVVCIHLDISSRLNRMCFVQY